MIENYDQVLCGGFLGMIVLAFIIVCGCFKKGHGEYYAIRR